MLVASKTIKGLTVNSVTGQIKRFGKAVKVRTDSKYPYVTIKVNGHKRSIACHRLVVETLTNKPANSTIHHCNHNRSDYRPSNLAIVTRATHNIIEYNEFTLLKSVGGRLSKCYFFVQAYFCCSPIEIYSCRDNWLYS